MGPKMDAKRESVVYIGPRPDVPDPRLALRARANLAIRVTPSGWLKWRCPNCHSEIEVKLRPGKCMELYLLHEPWCPVLLGEEAFR